MKNTGHRDSHIHVHDQCRAFLAHPSNDIMFCDHYCVLHSTGLDLGSSTKTGTTVRFVYLYLKQLVANVTLPCLLLLQLLLHLLH